MTVFELANYVGIRGWARKLRANRARMRALSRQPAMAYLVRGPGLVGSMLIVALRRQGRPFGLEVVGDPVAVLHSGIVRGPSAHVLGLIAARRMRRQCAAAPLVSYVTEGQLQRLYPPLTAKYVTHYSSIELPEAAFAKTPRVEFSVTPVLVNVAVMSQRYKGQDVLLRAVADLASEKAAVRVCLVGDGRLRADLESLARELLVSERVSFVGHLESGPAVRAELDRADLFVLPSRTEGLPRALIEAMARGLPCVASRVGGIPELLPDDDMVPADDPAALASAISSVFAEPGRFRKMSRRNLERAREYSSKELEKRRDSFYTELRLLAESSTGDRKCSRG